GNAAQELSNPACRTGIEPLHGYHDDENSPVFTEGVDCFCDRSQIMLIRALCCRAGAMEVNGAVVRILVGAGDLVDHKFSQGCAYRPFEGIDRAHHQYGSASVPTNFTQRLSAAFGRLRLEGPSGISA